MPQKVFRCGAALSHWLMIAARVKPIHDEFAEFDRPDVPGLVLMVIENGEASVTRSFGLANLETGVRCEPHTNFRLASVTKQFTAMAIMMLAEQGLLSLDDKLPRFFPNFPPYGKEITIRQLLTHTSGLPDYEYVIPDDATVAVKDRDVLEILRRQEEEPYFPPGARFGYSNSGYALLALIVDIISGLGFAQFLRENIFLPLGMNNTVAYEAGKSEVPHRALGYSEHFTERGLAFTETDQSDTSSVLGDGGIYSSVLDLFQWDQALYTEKLIRRSLLREAFTAQSKVSDMRGSGYGFGWYVKGQGYKKHLWHYGTTCGFTTSFHRLPAKKRSVILLANRRIWEFAPNSPGLEKMARKFAR